MKLTVFGAGAMGSLYAGKLALAGHDVAVVSRGERRAALERDGIRMRSRGSSRVERASVRAIGRADEHAAEAILVLVRRHQIDGALAALRESSGDVVMMANAAKGYDAYRAVLGRRFFIGFPGATGTFVEDGVLEYEIVPAAFQATTLGEPSGPPTLRVHRLTSALRAAGLPVEERSDMDAWQRAHAAWITPFMLAGATAERDDRTFADTQLLARGLLATRESFEALRAMGMEPTPASVRAMGMVPVAATAAIVRVAMLAAPNLRAHFVATGVDSRVEALALAADLRAAASSVGVATPALDSLVSEVSGQG